jgi:hypothetical protein
MMRQMTWKEWLWIAPLDGMYASLSGWSQKYYDRYCAVVALYVAAMLERPAR